VLADAETLPEVGAFSFVGLRHRLILKF
jgi:hypothetical protein